MDEFLKQKLDIVYQEEIEAWFNYLDQQRFGKKLEKKMMTEIERYLAGKKTIDELIDGVFEKPEIEIEFLNNVPQNYFYKAMLS